MARGVLICAVVFVVGILTGCESLQAASPADKPAAEKSGQAIQYVQTDAGRWMVHDMNRPAPPVVTPGTASTPETSGKAPSDAIVLFDGNDLSQWESERGGPAKWIGRDGYMEAVKGSGSVKTRQEFGSCQLHVEFATPTKVTGSGQGRGNSGVFLQGTYEVQVLDSYENKTYADGQCAALYGRAVPLVNTCRKPGEWQTYDIIFHRPLFDKDGKVARKATFTVLHNGVLVQDHVALEGGTGWLGPHAVTEYKPHSDKGPIMLQDHDNPVRFRNIWLRELKD